MTLLTGAEVATPATLSEALRFLADRPDEDWRPIAGGTDVMVGVNAGVETGRRWLDLSRLHDEIGGIGEEDGRIRVGALSTMTALRRSELVRQACPLCGEAAATVGAIQIQNRATVGGNIVNASPAGDTLPVWLVLDAEVELASSAGVRRVPYREFTPSYRTTARQPNELVTAILFSPLPRAGTYVLFRKIGTRRAQAISKIVFAGVRRVEEDGRHVDVRLAFGSVGPVPVLARAASAAALGHPANAETGEVAAALLDRDLSPIDDVRSTAAYRRATARHLVREFLAGQLGRAL